MIIHHRSYAPVNNLKLKSYPSENSLSEAVLGSLLWTHHRNICLLTPPGELKEPTFVLYSDLYNTSKSPENSCSASQVIYWSKKESNRACMHLLLLVFFFPLSAQLWRTLGSPVLAKLICFKDKCLATYGTLSNGHQQERQLLSPGSQCRPCFIQFLIIHFCPEHLCTTNLSPKFASFDISTSRQRPVSLLMIGPFWERVKIKWSRN